MATPTELDTFKIMSNVDYVDWSRGPARVPANVTIEEVDEDDHDRGDRPISPPPPPSPPRSPPSLRPASPAVSVRSRSTASLPSSPPREMPKRAMPVPKKYTAQEENEDYEVRAEKEAILQDLHNFSRPPTNMKLTREFNVDVHTLDELQFEYDRIQSELNANQMVDYAKQGIKFGVGGIEMFLKNSGFVAVDGWYKNSCADMNKYNRPLLKLYKRYWRKVSMSPVAELSMLLFGSLAWTVAENKMGLKPKAPAPAPAPSFAEFSPPGGGGGGGGMKPPSMAGKGPRWTSSPPDSPKKPSPKSKSPESSSSERSFRINLKSRTPRSTKSKRLTPLRL